MRVVGWQGGTVASARVRCTRCSSVALGIDLGTTNSAVARVVGRTATILTGPDGRRTTPSVVSFTPAVLVGAPAVRAASANAENTFFSVKRLLGRSFADEGVQEELSHLPFQARAGAGGGVLLHCPALSRGLAPEAVSALVLRQLASFAAPQEAPLRAVLAVPARFDDAQRQATLTAAAAAGLDVLRLLNEPTAAALAYGFGCPAGGGQAASPGEEVREEELVLVFDLGGGTLDVSLLDVSCGVFQVLASSGDARLGGNDFDAVVVSWLREQQQLAGGAVADSAQSLLVAAEALKVALSQETQVAVSLAPGGAQAVLTRAELERRCATLLARCAQPLHRVLEDAVRSDGRSVAPEDLAAVLLVGGATRMPAVRALVREVTRQDPREGVDPDEVVALGCAVQAAALAGLIDRGDAIVLDETPEADDFAALLAKMQATLDRAEKASPLS